MKKAIPQSASFEVPLAPIESSKLHDPEAEAVIQYAEQEKKAEEEQIAKSLNDPINVHAQVQQQQQAQLQEEPTVFDDGQPVGDGVVLVHNPEATGPVPLSDPGLAVPVTPPRDDVTLDCPRGSSTVRANDPGGAESEESKRAKVEEAKKQRINRLQLEYEERLSAVRIAYKEYFTMDGYSTDLDVDDDLCEVCGQLVDSSLLLVLVRNWFRAAVVSPLCWTPLLLWDHSKCLCACNKQALFFFGQEFASRVTVWINV